MNIKKYKALIDSGLLSEQFIRHADDTTSDSAEFFADHYNSAVGGDRSIGALMIQHGVLTSRLVENTIIAGNLSITERWATALGSTASPALEQLIKNGALGTATAMQLLKQDRKALTNDATVKRLAAILTPGAGNAVNSGITDIFEHEAALATALSGRSRRDEFLNEEHRLMKAMRTTQHVREKRRQVEAVVSANDSWPLPVQLEAVWQHYAAQSKLFKEIGLERPVSGQVRARNVACVNNRQARKTKNQIQEPQRRFIDIYGRYNCAEMDPLMLAMIARTVGWYIDNQHARLFTHIRLVPDRFGSRTDGIDSMPWAALALYPKMSRLNVTGEEFRSSLLGANRFFLTHSRATDATDKNSIPIIGLATWQNPSKFADDEPYALFGADFDKGDMHRSARRQWKGEDQAASIMGVIEETLRALREVEELEIARANNIPLSLGKDHRWTARPTLADMPRNLGRLAKGWLKLDAA